MTERCFVCGESTGRAGEDSIYAGDERSIGPFCDGCWLAVYHEVAGRECRWSFGSPVFEPFYQTSCGHQFVALAFQPGTGTGVTHCPACGGLVQVVPS